MNCDGRIRNLRGAQLPEPSLRDLDPDQAQAFDESQAILIAPSGQALPLYPLFSNPGSEAEPFLYDGHYGIQVQTKQRREERSYIYCLGTHARPTDEPACQRPQELPGNRQLRLLP